MTSPEHSTEIADALQVLDREWRRLQLSRTDRRELAADVAADLEAAAADGVGPAQLLGTDPTGFAREAAGSQGYIPQPSAYGRTLVGGFAGLVVTAVVAYLVSELLYATVVQWVDLPFQWGGVGGAILFLGVVALAELFGTLAGVRLALRGRWAARATVTRAGLTLPVIVGAAGGIATVYAQYRDVATDSQTVTTEIAIVTLGWVVALAAARWWALGSAAPVSDDRDLISH